MKYIKKLNIDFDNWGDIPMTINEQQIKELHPIFYKFLIKNKLMNIYLEMFDKCHKDRGNTFEEIMNSYKNLPLGLIISYTLSFKCVNKEHNLYYDISSLNDKFRLYYKIHQPVIIDP
jgi:hypothetical protein